MLLISNNQKPNLWYYFPEVKGSFTCASADCALTLGLHMVALSWHTLVNSLALVLDLGDSLSR